VSISPYVLFSVSSLHEEESQLDEYLGTNKEKHDFSTLIELILVYEERKD